jgi:hypothetical protein
VKKVSEGGFGKGEVEETAFEYGVAYELDGKPAVILVDDEGDARELAKTIGGEPVIRALHFMAWAELEG